MVVVDMVEVVVEVMTEVMGVAVVDMEDEVCIDLLP